MTARSAKAWLRSTRSVGNGSDPGRTWPSLVDLGVKPRPVEVTPGVQEGGLPSRTHGAGCPAQPGR